MRDCASRSARPAAHRPEGAAGSNWKGTAQGLVFTTKNGTSIEPRNLNRSFEALCVRAGVRKVRFYDLRHTCASLLHEQGADARMIMEVLGHRLDSRDHGHLHLRTALLPAVRPSTASGTH
ncbi:tyrosine-type recombinase/integrase [Streptomyces massasporeus]|uniref:tyrosine-type recombinase/integrase n=1 Tax=Streptomyces massasporeus TaxID=67324 RepID=UPI0033BBE00D